LVIGLVIGLPIAAVIGVAIDVRTRDHRIDESPN
jgi:hypothetical protein